LCVQATSHRAHLPYPHVQSYGRTLEPQLVGAVAALKFYSAPLTGTALTVKPHHNHLSSDTTLRISLQNLINMADALPTKRGAPKTAPTPQNTPASNAPISSHAAQPGVPSIEEGEHILSPKPVFSWHNTDPEKRT
jgi:hypothetical protein